MKYKQETINNIVSLRTAKLLKEIDCPLKGVYHYSISQEGITDHYNFFIKAKSKNYATAPLLHEVQGWIREDRGINIYIDNNATGYYWEMCKVEGGTGLGYSGDVVEKFEKYNECLEHAIQCNLVYPLPDNLSDIKHWSNYGNEAIKRLNKLKENEN